ncbi:DUF6011 domain-containing protein [Anaerovorax sp. IOR16]|uniref:DUF6011 domain-containing protein n=1 Tax=Anaerovorax sp. IOR16 TaxID=2773458 RepID=UPI0019CFCDB9|nr:DUF6011 domain-containing protein [Anaerovorax sp. IOR16]
MSEVRCGRCNRVLKDISCIETGYGRSCYRKLFGKSISKKGKQPKIGKHQPLKPIKHKNEETPPLFMDEENFKDMEDKPDE